MNDRIIFYGTESLYKKTLPILEKNNLRIVAHIEEPANQIVLNKKLLELSYDYIIACREHFEKIADCIGIEKAYAVFIDHNILYENNFDYQTYESNGWITSRIINKTISDYTYSDFPRTFRNNNIEVNMGRKSHIVNLKFEDFGIERTIKVNIGNYTGISSNVTVEVGLNLDHDYSRVMNYGYSHLKGFEHYLDKLYNDTHSLTLGSDIWFGMNSRIKTGVTVGDGAVIAANSYVVSDVPDYAIVGGNPARVIKYRFNEEIISRLKALKWWNMPEDVLLKYRDYFDSPETFIKILEAERKTS